MSTSVVGRDAELGALRDFVTGISDGASALVLEGEAGMGKTTLWRAGVEAAEVVALCVLRAEPAESETALSFSGLGDLLDPVLDEALEPLPAGQRSALARALVLEEVEGPPPDAHAAGVALLNVFRGLAGTRSVLVAVDDVQWLDAASARALAYAARRLKSEHVGVLLARRSGVDSVLLDELRRTSRCRDLSVGPLDPTALHQVVQAHLGVALPRPLLEEVRQASGGNPFYAIEIVRTLTRSGVSVEAGRPLPLPDSLHDLVHGRLLALPPESRDFLIAAAAHAHPTITITETASGVARAKGLAPAVDARIVEIDGDRIRFTHPLLAAGALETADPVRRAGIHSRLAELLDDPEARAWQLAASVYEPDEAVAAVLEDAAAHARNRGALRPAALLLDCAEQLTPPGSRDDTIRRAVEAAYLHFESGDSPRAEAQLQALIGSLAPGEQRARALWTFARIRTYEAPEEAAELFLEVIAEAEQNREILAAAHEGVASSLYYALDRLDESARHSDTALSLARELGNRALQGDILISKLGAEVMLGRAGADSTAAEALELQKVASGRLLDQPLLAVAEYWLLTDRQTEARATFIDLLQQSEDVGDESSRPYLLFLIGEAECLLGDLDSALEHARDGHAAAVQAGQPLFSAYNLALQSLAHAQLGREADVRASAGRALEAVPGGVPYAKLIVSTAVGHLEHVSQASENVVSTLAPILELVRRGGIVEPTATRFVVDYVEALVELGRTDDAAELLGSYERSAVRLERVSALANCARCRGMLHAHAGELDAALAAYRDGLELHARVELPLDRARTLLALGAAQRRAKRRREARETLEQALEVFGRIGAALWAERTRAELKRISGRAATPGALTPAEERVAVLVAEGKTNREVAAALFLSERTVEGHLAHIFGKLGVRNRRQIASVLAPTQEQGLPGSNPGGGPVSAESSAP